MTSYTDHNKILIFNDEVIQKLFGHEAAEDEDVKRLKEYYIKGKVYERIRNNLQLRILVAPKGVGKSALFKIAEAEDEEQKILSTFIRPDDVKGIHDGKTHLNNQIERWKSGILDIIQNKVFEYFGTNQSNSTIASTSIKLVKGFTEALALFYEKTPLLDMGKNKVRENFLKSKTITVYVDDLDRGWQGTRLDVERISALLNAIRDITRDEPNLKFRVSLRSDVYYLYRKSDESTDKTEGQVVWLSWKNHEILALLVKRVNTYFNCQPTDDKVLNGMEQKSLAVYLDKVMAPRFIGRGKWENAPIYRVLMSLIRQRPRDLVKLCTLAARRAYERDSSLIETQDWESIFNEYSQGRLQDTVNEYKSEFPAIERLLLSMRPTKKEKECSAGYLYTFDELVKKIKSISDQFSLEFANPLYSTRLPAKPAEVIAFLYKINFLTARTESEGKIQRLNFEENRYIINGATEFGYQWEIHPAYRWVLQPESPKEILKTLDMGNE